MSKSGVIILIDDDADDQLIFKLTLAEMKVNNEIVIFNTTAAALDFLDRTTRSIFIIFCDINLPGESGLDFKLDIDSNPTLRRKSIPFIFHSSAAMPEQVEMAYTQMTVQGFFKKTSSVTDNKLQLKMIIDYWMSCKHPNN
jgi:CheY-like chemotaxis protein